MSFFVNFWSIGSIYEISHWIAAHPIAYALLSEIVRPTIGGGVKLLMKALRQRFTSNPLPLPRAPRQHAAASRARTACRHTHTH